MGQMEGKEVNVTELWAGVAEASDNGESGHTFVRWTC